MLAERWKKTKLYKRCNAKGWNDEKFEDFIGFINMLVKVLCVFIYFTLIICNTVVASGSMEPTLMTGEHAIFNKLAYKFEDIQRGDIVNFWFEEEQSYYTKRVVGIPGDVITFKDGALYINGCKADESAYLEEGTYTGFTAPKQLQEAGTMTFTVPEGYFFYMGDARECSYDARYYKEPYMPIDAIVGKYMFSIPNPFYEDTEEDKIGRLLLQKIRESNQKQGFAINYDDATIVIEDNCANLSSTIIMVLSGIILMYTFLWETPHRIYRDIKELKEMMRTSREESCSSAL